MKLIVYLDMDGVIADLHTGLNRWAGTKDIASDPKRFFYELERFTMATGFQTIPKMPKADELVAGLLNLRKKKIINLSILTSGGGFYKPQSEVVVQKKRWLERNFPELKEIPFATTSSGVSKADFASANSVLIDDTVRNIDAFTKAGGLGVLYSENLPFPFIFQMLEIRAEELQ